MLEDAYDAEELDDDGRVNVFDVFPGGDRPDPVEVWAAVLIGSALLYLVLVRRAFPIAQS